jgi:outer membrane receptor protein involved in Fe transport
VLYVHGLSQGRLESLPMEWLFAVRRSTSGDSFDVADPELGKPYLQDVLGRIQLDVGENAQLTVGGLLLDDQMDLFEFTEDGGPGATYRDTTGWLAWRQEWASGAALDALVSTTRARSTREGSVIRHRSAQLTERRHVEMGTVRVELTLPLSDAQRSALGLEWADSAAYFRESMNIFLPDENDNTLIPDVLGKNFSSSSRMFDLARDRTSFAAYGTLYSQLSERLSTEIGLRWDVQDHGARREAMQVTPRYSAAYRASDRTLIRAALGWQAQSQRPYELRAADGEKEFHPAERVRQAVLSLDHRLSDMIDMRFEAYAKRVRDPAPYYENMFDPVTIFPELEVDRVQVLPEEARMYGAEISLRWALPEAWSGWFQYTWSDAKDVIEGRSVPRTWSTPHAMNAGLAWSRFPWQLTVSPHWRKGWRTTLLSQSETDRGDLQLGPRNSERWPDFFSLDVRASWSYPMRWGELRFLGEVLNATDAATICCAVYTAQGTAPLLSRSLQDGLPRTYYLGLTWKLP